MGCSDDFTLQAAFQWLACAVSPSLFVLELKILENSKTWHTEHFFLFFGKHYLLVLLLLLISCLLANLPLCKSCMLSISFPSSFCMPVPQQRYRKSPFPPSYLHSPIKHLDVKISQLLAGCLPKSSLRFWLTRKWSKFFLTDHVGSVKV